MPDSYNFPVELQTISTEPGGFIIPNRLAVIRTDTMRPIAVVSRKYALLPHTDVVDTLRETLKGQEMRETITVSHNGARMHFEIILPEMSLSVEHDEISMRLVVGNSYDGSRKVTIAFGAYRVVCANGMIIGRKLLSVSHRHLGEVSLQVAQIREQIAELTKLFKNSAPIMRKMASTALTSNKQFFDAKSLRIPTYLARIASQQFSRAEDPTVWDAYNALTYAITHKMRKQNPELAARLGKNAWTAALARLK